MITELVRRGLDDERRWDDVEATLGAIADDGHEWDGDPAIGFGFRDPVTPDASV